MSLLNKNIDFYKKQKNKQKKKNIAYNYSKVMYIFLDVEVKNVINNKLCDVASWQCLTVFKFNTLLSQGKKYSKTTDL